MRRFVITVDTDGTQLNDGPVLTSPMGGVIVYQGEDAETEANEAARRLVEGGSVKGAFVQLLTPTTFYLPDSAGSVDAPVKENVGAN